MQSEPAPCWISRVGRRSSPAVAAALARRPAGDWPRVARLSPSSTVTGGSPRPLPREIVAGGGTARAFVCDITDRPGVDAAVSETQESSGGLDPGQQCRLRHLQAVSPDKPRGMGAADRRQPDRRAPHAPCRTTGHGRSQTRAHHQHCLGRAPVLARRGGSLCGPARRRCSA